MEHQHFNIEGPILITPKILGDERGFFCESFRVDRFQGLGIANTFVQDNLSRSAYGILRGLHFQWNKPQSKLVTCTRGLILDVAVDIRKSSPTYGQYVSQELSGTKPQWLWIPAGFAHGFIVLSKEGADVNYKVDAYWNGAGESGILWNDPEIGIQWPIGNPILSEKDRVSKTFADYKRDPRF